MVHLSHKTCIYANYEKAFKYTSDKLKVNPEWKYNRLVLSDTNANTDHSHPTIAKTYNKRTKPNLSRNNKHRENK